VHGLVGRVVGKARPIRTLKSSRYRTLIFRLVVRNFPLVENLVRKRGRIGWRIKDGPTIFRLEVRQALSPPVDKVRGRLTERNPALFRVFFDGPEKRNLRC
jgi:hypothetical protein